MTFSFSPSFSMKQSKCPATQMYMLSPVSPCRMMDLPEVTSTLNMAFTICTISCWFRERKRISFSRYFVSSAFSPSVLGTTRRLDTASVRACMLLFLRNKAPTGRRVSPPRTPPNKSASGLP